MKIPDKFKFIDLIGEGNFGKVMLCENTYFLRKEAVKIINLKGKDEKDRAEELKNLLFEPSVLDYLRKSKYIVEVYNADIFQDGLMINMEYLKNGSVQGLLNKNDFLNIRQICKISECVLQALEYAHNMHILHLDIKPGNILIKNNNTYKLSDFGLSRVKNKNGTSSFDEIYTKHIPPERLSEHQTEATEQTDIYMFGITIYRLLNGDLHMAEQWDFFAKKNTLEDSIISGKFPDRKKYLYHVHKRLKSIINKCLNIDLNRRYKNIREVRNDFGKIKLECNWIYKNISENKHYWKCFCNKNLFLELIAEKDNNLWEISLKKCGRTRKMRVVKHCKKKLRDDELNKRLRDIFNEYF